MRIIISPAKKMKQDTDFFEWDGLPLYLEDTERLLSCLKAMSYEQAKDLWCCNDQIATLNFRRIQKMDLTRSLTPAIFSYEGIQYQYMAPGVFQTEELQYIQAHLRILSGFYGMLRPFDGVVPYRLEMQAKLRGQGFASLYDFWGSRLAEQLFSETSCIVNLASKEYSKCISPYLAGEKERIRFVTCVFGEWKAGKIVEKGTQVKMARGEMVRFMAEHQIKDVEELKGFDRLNYGFSEELSQGETLVFVKRPACRFPVPSRS